MGRMTALYRLGGLVYFALIGWLVLLIAGAAGLIFMVVDVLMELIFGGSGWTTSEAGAAGFLKSVYDYGDRQLTYVLFGTGNFPIIP